MTGPDGGCAPDVREARAAWSRLVEPGDVVAGAVIAALGPVDALTWLREVVGPDGRVGHQVTLPGLPPAVARRLAVAVRRWAPRVPTADPRRELDVLHRMGGVLLVPEDVRWPSALDALGPAAPACLWVRGDPDLAGLLRRSVALIGARACTAYGERVTSDLASGLAVEGWTVVSGGAYGIDAVAHRAALAVDGRTIAVLAGGVDRAYPAGNARLLAAVAAEGGSLVSEVPPGSVPSRSRFLQRNRLIAGASQATVVVEAAWRSGALNTAGHAGALLRPVGAVPGPVTSAASAGCHRLLREGAAVCVTDTAEVLDLVGQIGGDASAGPTVPTTPWDDLGMAERRTLEALPLRGQAGEESLARVAGLAVGEVRSALGALELRGSVRRGSGGWRRALAGQRSGTTPQQHAEGALEQGGTG